MGNFSREEVRRYARHLALPEIGVDGQQKLKEASVLVVGAGGLGCPALLYLAAAGVGRIGIIDSDRVEESNLQRQVAFTMEDLGQPKALAIQKRLKALNPLPEISARVERLTASNALDILNDYNIIVDGTDNFPTRYLINDACLLLKKTCVHASVFRFEGHVSVFNNLRADGSRGPNYRDLFPEPPPPEQAPNCAEAGVLGVLTGIIGSLQASEVIKLITGVGEPLDGKLLIMDSAGMRFQKISLPPGGAHQVTQLIDYEAFCQTSSLRSHIPHVSSRELKELFDEGADFQLIDVREPYEHEYCNLGGELIPIGEFPDNLDRIDRHRKVIIYCRSGQRSGDLVRLLQEQFGYTNLFNLRGGILAWSDEVDPGVPKY